MKISLRTLQNRLDRASKREIALSGQVQQALRAPRVDTRLVIRLITQIRALCREIYDADFSLRRERHARELRAEFRSSFKPSTITSTAS